MGDYLRGRNLTVSRPLLAGHGTTPEHLAGTTWHDWHACVHESFEDLQQCCEEVFVAGFSLGSLLAVHLGVHHRMAGLMLMSPAVWVGDWRVRLLPLARHFVKFVLKDADLQHSDLTDPEAYQRFWCYDSYPVAPAYQL